MKITPLRKPTQLSRYNSKRPNIRQRFKWSKLKRGSLLLLLTILLTPSLAMAQLLTAPPDDPTHTSTVNQNNRFESATTCQGCHASQYDQWSTSMMGYSSKSPVIHALELSENHTSPANPSNPNTNLPFGRFSRQSTSTGPHEENGLFCQKCHAPVAVFADVFDNVTYTAQNRGSIVDSHMQLQDIAATHTSAEVRANATTAQEGVTCTVCHRINGRDFRVSVPLPNNTILRPNYEPGIANSAYRIQGGAYLDEPNYSGQSPLNYGPFNNTSTNSSLGIFNMQFLSLALDPFTSGNGHNADVTLFEDSLGNMLLGEDGLTRPFIQTGEFCGACHDVRIPAQDMGTGEPFRRVENLFTEWRNSPWNNNDGVVNGDFTNTNSGLPDSHYRPGNTLQSALNNPREVAQENDGSGNMVDIVEPTTGEHIKRVTTCQDCHMSEYMTDSSAKAGKYAQGRISSFSAITDRVSNHRFIGVDKTLIDGYPDISDISNPNDFPDLNLDNISSGDAREILLQKAVDFKIVSGTVADDLLPIEISVTNTGAGHNIPAGLSQERQVWIELFVRDKNDTIVYKSGYLRGDDNLNGICEPGETDCGDLDDIIVTLNNRLEIQGTLQDGPDHRNKLTKQGLINYENEFMRQKRDAQNNLITPIDVERVFSQFIGDQIDNTHALRPFEENIEEYNIPVNASNGPFKVSARLRFRPFPPEFLRALEQTPQFPTSRVTEDVISRNTIIEMEQDECVSGSEPDFINNIRACNPVRTVVTGNGSTCSISGGGSVKCWGSGANGKLGDGDLSSHNALEPMTITDLANVTMIDLGSAHACALTSNGNVKCWGSGSNGQLGNGSTSNVASPTLVANLSGVISISTGKYHTCAVLENSTIQCWGEGDDGKLGDNNTQTHDQTTPTTVQEVVNGSLVALSDVKMVAAGADHTCALLNTGEVKCWGYRLSGRLGDGTSSTSGVGLAQSVIGINYKATSISVGDDASCVTLSTGGIKCWGYGRDGILGDGNTASHSSSTAVSIQNLLEDELDFNEKAVQVSVGDEHACATISKLFNGIPNSIIKCWGRGYLGRLGDGNTGDHSIGYPQVVASGLSIQQISAGRLNTCASLLDGSVYCWGSGSSGANGNGSTSHQGLPVQALLPSFTIFSEDSEDSVDTFTNASTTSNRSWTRLSVPTISSPTGPDFGAKGSDSYYYMETSSSAGNEGQDVTFVSGFFPPTDAQLSFDYHMYGSAIGKLIVDVEAAGVWYLEQWVREGEQSEQGVVKWLSATLDLNQYASLGHTRVRLRAVTKAGTVSQRWLGDTAVDNILIQTN